MSARLHTVVTGSADGPVIVWLHGFLGSAADWRPVCAHLPTYRHVAVELPGHGASVGLPAACYAFEGVLAALDATLAGLAPYTLVGYSMGGRLALAYALTYPTHLHRLVLIGASPGLRTDAERTTRNALDDQRAAALTADFPAFLESWYRQPLFASLGRVPGRVERQIAARQGNDPHELARALRGAGTGMQPSYWDALPTLAVPTRALAGSLDSTYVQLAHAMAAVSPQIQPLEIPEAGHAVHIEQPERLATVVTAAAC